MVCDLIDLIQTIDKYPGATIALGCFIFGIFYTLCEALIVIFYRAPKAKGKASKEEE